MSRSIRAPAEGAPQTGVEVDAGGEALAGEGGPSTSSSATPAAALHAVFHQLPVAVYTCDAAGLVTYFNPRAELLWGRAPKLHDPEDRFCGSFRLLDGEGTTIPRADCWMAKALREGRDYHGVEVTVERDDGVRVIVLAHVSVLTDGGVLTGAVNVLVDITERKRAEQQREQLETTLRHAERLRSLATMASGTAHELNNVLQIILSHAELLRAGVVPPDDCSEAIAQAAQRGRRAVESFLSVGGRTGAQRPIQVGAFLNEARHLAKMALQPAVEVIEDVSSELSAGISLVADPAEIQQAFLECCRGAAEALQGGGQLFVGHELIRVADEVEYPELTPGEYVAIVVRAEASEAPITSGSGRPPSSQMASGLSVARAIVNRYKGCLRRERGGRRATLILPISPGAERRTGRSLRVLFVDDEPRVVSAALRGLTVLGHIVTGYVDPWAALSAIEADPHAFDALITDLSMSQLSGEVLALSVRRLRPEIALVFLTGHELMHQPSSLGTERIAFLRKPASMTELDRILVELAS